MGFFDFLRRKRLEQEKPNLEMSLGEIRAKVDEEYKILNDNSTKLVERAKFLLNEIIPKLKSCLVFLGLINLEKRREDERLKAIVKENIRIYIYHLERLIEDFEKLNQTTDFNDHVIQIERIFENFSKNSAKSHEKATILVGTEFEAIHREFKNFSREFNPLKGEIMKNRERMEKLGKFAENFRKISDAEKAEEQIKNLIFELDAWRKQKEEEIQKKAEELKNFKESEGYKKDIEERGRIEEERRELEKEIWMLQKKINLKELARIHHGNERKHKIIKHYTENFKKAMEGDEQMELAKILKEAGVSGIDLDGAKEKSERLESYVSPNETKIRKMEKEAEKIKDEINEIGENKRAEEDKLERFKKRISELKLEAGEFFKTLGNV